MLKKIILISILVLLTGILIPYFSYWQKSEWQILLYIISIIAGFFILLFLYLKKPVFILFLIPPSIIFGQVATLKIRDWYYQISIPEILIVILTLFFVIQTIAQKKQNRVKFPFLLILFGLYITLSFISLGWAQNFSRGIIALRIMLFHLLILFLVVNLVKNKKDLKITLFSLPLAGFLVASQLIYKVALLGGFTENYTLSRQAIVTPVGKWVYIAAIIALTLPFTCVFLLKHKKIWLKLLLSLQTILGLIAIGLTLGKGEIIAIAGGLFYFFKKQKIQKYLGIIILVIVLLIAVFPLASYGGKILERIYRTFDDPNTDFRIAEFKAARKIFLEKPFWGVGIGNLKLEYKNLLPWSVETESNNLILQIVLELGFLGLVIFFLIGREIYFQFKKMKSRVKKFEDRIILLGFISTMIVVIINALVEVTLIGLYYGVIFWYILGLLLVQNNLLLKKHIIK